MTVTCADEDQVADDDTRTVDEDSGATEIDVEDNDDDDGRGVTTIDHLGLEPRERRRRAWCRATRTRSAYTPDADYCNDPGAAPTDDFTYTMTGGAYGDRGGDGDLCSRRLE